MAQTHEQDDQKQEKEIKFDAARYSERLDDKFKSALEVGVVDEGQRAGWKEGMLHCGQQVESATTPEAKVVALQKAIEEAHSLLGFLDNMTREAQAKNLDEETFKDLTSSGWLSPAEHARYWSAYQSAETKEDKIALQGEMQRVRKESKDIHDGSWQKLAGSDIARQPENQKFVKELEAKFWAATATEKYGVVAQLDQALKAKAQQQEKFENKVQAAEGAANDYNFEQPTEQPISTLEQQTQRFEKAETQQHDKGMEQVAANDALYTADDTTWINTFKKIDEGATYTTAQKKMEEFAESEGEIDDRAVDDFQSMASQRQAHQEGEGGGMFDRFKSALGFGGEKESLVGSAEAEAEQEAPEVQRAGQVLQEIGLKQRDQLLAPLENMGITNIQDFQKEKLAKVLLTEKDAKKRQRKIQDVMEGREAA